MIFHKSVNPPLENQIRLEIFQSIFNLQLTIVPPTKHRKQGMHGAGNTWAREHMGWESMGLGLRQIGDSYGLKWGGFYSIILVSYLYKLRLAEG